MFKTTEWEFSGVRREEMQYKGPIEGDRYLFIEDVSYDDDTTRYTINVRDLGDQEVRYRLYYNLSKVDKVSGQLVPNISTRNTLVGLGRALFGKDVGVPFPGDIIGAVVRAQVKVREYNGKKYANVYEFNAVPEEMAVFSEIDQYYEGYDEDEWEEDGSDAAARGRRSALPLAVLRDGAPPLHGQGPGPVRGPQVGLQTGGLGRTDPVGGQGPPAPRHGDQEAHQERRRRGPVLQQELGLRSRRTRDIHLEGMRCPGHQRAG